MFTSFPPPLLQDAIVHAVLAVGLLAGAVALIVFLPEWRQCREYVAGTTFVDDVDKVIESSEATIVSCVSTCACALICM